MAETTTITELKKFILTQAQYDALLAAGEVERNAEYYITDAAASGYPYFLDFGMNRENTQQVVLNIQGMEDGVPTGVQMYLMRNLPKKKHVTNLDDGSKTYHYTSGWRHPMHGEDNNIVYNTEWDLVSPNTWTKDTGECFAQFVRYGQDEGDNKPAFARINGRSLGIKRETQPPHYMEWFHSTRPITAFGFALFKDGVRVSNICPVKITVYGDMEINNGEADKLSIYAYPA